MDAIVFLPPEAGALVTEPVCGLPLLARVVRRLERAGVRAITLVGGLDGAALGPALGSYPHEAELTLSTSFPASPVARGGGVVLLWDACLLADAEIAPDLVDGAADLGAAVVALDPTVRPEAAPALRWDGGLPRPAAEPGQGNAAALGAMALPASALESLGPRANPRSVEGVLDLLLESGHRVFGAPVHRPWIRVRGRRDRRSAERLLLEELRKPMETDGFLGALVYRNLSLPVTRWVCRTKLLPNHATALALVLGLAAAGAMAAGSVVGFLVGATLLQLGAIVDCIDGELARLKDQGSLAGAWFDTVTDDVVNNSFLLGTGIGLARFHGSLWPLVVAISAVALIVPGLAFLYRELRRMGRGDLCDFVWTFEEGLGEEGAGKGAAGPMDGALMGRLQSVLKYAVKRDVYVTFFLVLALAGAPELIPVFGLVGAVGFAVSVGRELAYRNRSARGRRERLAV